MESYSFRSSPFICVFAFTFIICINHASSIFETKHSYTKHCSSIIPPYNITAPSNGGESLPSLSTSYFTGGLRFQTTDQYRSYSYIQMNLRLRLRSDPYQTTAAGVYKVEGFLHINFPFGYNDAPLGLPMDGFWSENSRTLCMVGSAPWMAIDFDAVLKLKFDDANPSIYTGVVSGSLESTASANDPAFFDPILIFDFPASVADYSYSLLSEEIGAVFPIREGESLSLDSIEFCSLMERGLRSLELRYAAECAERPLPRRCSPIGFGDDFLPNYLSLGSIQCAKGAKKARFLAKFLKFSGQDYDNFGVGSTVIGEAWWDGRTNSIVGVACGILNPILHFENSVGDCSMRLSLRQPSALTMRNDGIIMGELWSSKAVEDSGYFRQINLTVTDDYGAVVSLPEQRYEYREMDSVRKWCTKTKEKKKRNGNAYPDGQSSDMAFDLNMKSVKGEEGSASATPVWVENDPYQRRRDFPHSSDVEPKKRGLTSPTKMSYKIRVRPNFYSVGNVTTASINWPVMFSRNDVLIVAEGEYDTDNGHLCMVGCRLLAQNSITTSKDCELVVELDLPMLTGERGRLVKGIIRSTRPQTDPLHFEDLVMESTAYNSGEAARSLGRMDFEIAMVFISSTLVCIFVALQIFHVKRNPEVSSSVSLVMLVVLCAEHAIPLVLNFEETGNWGRLEANKTAIRVITLVALILQLRLLQLVWTSKNSWGGERRAGLVSVSFYILGCLLALHLMKTYYDWRFLIWRDLRCYGGVILDGFLLPQILLNLVKGSGSGEKALCRSFYVGTSAVRLVPHIYNQYRAHNYPTHDLISTYYYANPAANLYVTAWDIIVTCVIIALSVIVFVQQRHGGGRFLPRRFRGFEKN